MQREDEIVEIVPSSFLHVVSYVYPCVRGGSEQAERRMRGRTRRREGQPGRATTARPPPSDGQALVAAATASVDLISSFAADDDDDDDVEWNCRCNARALSEAELS